MSGTEFEKSSMHFVIMIKVDYDFNADLTSLTFEGYDIMSYLRSSHLDPLFLYIGDIKTYKYIKELDDM